VSCSLFAGQGPRGEEPLQKRLERICLPETSCVDGMLDCWFQCLNLLLCDSGTARGRPHIGLRAAAWCAKSLRRPMLSTDATLRQAPPRTMSTRRRDSRLSVSTEKDKIKSTGLRHVQTDASIEHVFGRISNYGVCLEPRARTEHHETRPRHGRLVSGRRRCKSCCIAGASAVCRQPRGEKGLRASCFRILPAASGDKVLQLRLFALVRTHYHSWPSSLLFLRRMAVIHRAAISITHTLDFARHPSLPGFPSTVGFPIVSAGHSRTTACQWATDRMTASSIAGRAPQFSSCCPTCPVVWDQSQDDPG
jgi:hypothetical protein